MIKRRPSGPTATPPAVPEEGNDIPKGGEVGERIGRELRAMFEDVVAEPVPEKFRRLLDELERKVRKP
jgi:hypothetical protein